MRFAAPQLLWLLTLLPVFVLVMLLAARRRRRMVARFAGGGAPLARFAGEVSPHRRVARALLLLLATAATVVAAARPQWGTRLEPITRAGVDVVVVLDTSLSMAAEDLAPSRLEYAKHAAGTLLDRLAGNRVGIVTFAGRATVMCPLTLDYAAARLFLDAVDLESVAVGGTGLAEALQVSLRLLREVADQTTTGRSQAIVLFSDGEDHEGGLEQVVEELRRGGVVIYPIGCGTAKGAPIPLPTGSSRFKKDRQGRIVTTRLDERTLEQVAIETRGRYHRGTPAELELEEVAQALIGMEAKELGNVLRVRYEERYQIPLGLALAALLAEMLVRDRRRGAVRPGEARG